MPKITDITLEVRFTAESAAYSYSTLTLSDSLPDSAQLSIFYNVTNVVRSSDGIEVAVSSLPAGEQLKVRTIDPSAYTVNETTKVIDNLVLPAGQPTGDPAYNFKNTLTVDSTEYLAVQRSTDVTSAVVNYQPGSRLTSAQLEAQKTQEVNALQELTNQFQTLSTGVVGPQGEPGETGATGAEGQQGPQGIQGPQGEPGSILEGVPSGGAQGTVLTKTSTTDYDVEWKPLPEASDAWYFRKSYPAMGSSTTGPALLGGSLTPASNTDTNDPSSFSNGVYTIPEDGTYMLSFDFSNVQQSTPNRLFGAIMLNGVQQNSAIYAYSDDLNTAGAYNMAGTTEVFQLSAGDEVAFQLEGQGGVSWRIAGANSSIVRISGVQGPPGVGSPVKWAFASRNLGSGAVSRSANYNGSVVTRVDELGDSGLGEYNTGDSSLTGSGEITFSDGQFTIPEDGVYMIDSKFCAGQVNQLYGRVVRERNGVREFFGATGYTYSQYGSTNSSPFRTSGTNATLDLEAGDKISIQIISNAGYTIYVESISIVKLDAIQGADGADGAPGVGVPGDGTAGQVLVKNSSTPYDLGWRNKIAVQGDLGSPVSNNFSGSRKMFDYVSTWNGSLLLDEGNHFDSSLSNGKITLPAGIYQVTGNLVLLDTYSANVNLVLYKNGTQYGPAVGGQVYDSPSSGNANIGATWAIKLNGTDELDLRVEESTSNGVAAVSKAMFTITEL